MSSLTPLQPEPDPVNELAGAIAGTVREIDFAVSCNNTDNDGIAVIQKGIPYIASLRSQLESLGYSEDLSQYSEGAARGAAFLEANGISIS